MHFTPIHTRIFKENEDLPAFIAQHVQTLAEETVLVISSKIVALWKGCTLPYESRAQKEKLIVQESQSALKTPLAWLTLKDGMVMTNAGIDESNAEGKLILLPRNLYVCAAEIRAALRAQYGLNKLGIIITDSMILPLRAGVIGAAVAYAGFKGVQDLRGKPDIFGKRLETTLVDAADSLSAAAALLMGEADERRPLCLITGAPVKFTDVTDPNEIKYPPEDDLYTPLLLAAGLIKQDTEKNEHD